MQGNIRFYSVIDQVRHMLNYDIPVLDVLKRAESSAELPQLIEDYLYWNGVITTQENGLCMAVADPKGNIIDEGIVEDIQNMTKGDISVIGRLVEAGRTQISRWAESKSQSIKRHIDEVIVKLEIVDQN